MLKDKFSIPPVYQDEEEEEETSEPEEDIETGEDEGWDE